MKVQDFSGENIDNSRIKKLLRGVTFWSSARKKTQKTPQIQCAMINNFKTQYGKMFFSFQSEKFVGEIAYPAFHRSDMCQCLDNDWIKFTLTVEITPFWATELHQTIANPTFLQHWQQKYI